MEKLHDFLVFFFFFKGPSHFILRLVCSSDSECKQSLNWFRSVFQNAIFASFYATENSHGYQKLTRTKIVGTENVFVG